MLMNFFPALFHLLTKKQKKVLTRTLNQHESGSKNTFNDCQKHDFFNQQSCDIITMSQILSVPLLAILFFKPPGEKIF